MTVMHKYRLILLPAVASLLLFSCTKGVVDTTFTKPETQYELIDEVQELTFRDFIDEAARGAEIDDSRKDIILAIRELGSGIIGDGRFRTYDISYPSKDFHGRDIKLSARVYVPAEAKSGDILPGAVLGNHHLIMADKYCPTNLCVIEALPVFFGYAVVVPDNIGFGISREMPQLLVNGNFNGKTGVEALSAGLNMLEDMGIVCNPGRLYNIGYSLGAHSALGALRYTSTHPESGIHFYKTFSGAGPYDPSIAFDIYSEGGCPNGLVFSIAGLASLIEESAGELNPSDVFKEPLLSTYGQLILSKNFSIFDIRKAIGTGVPSDYINDGVLSKLSDAGKKIESMSLTRRTYGGWEMAEGTELYLFGCKDDDYIPYENYESAKYFIESTFPDINLHCLSKATGGHVPGFFIFEKWVIDNWK